MEIQRIPAATDATRAGGPGRSGVAARNQIRRLPHARPSRSRRGAAAHPYRPRPDAGLVEALTAAGFAQAHVVESGKGFCALATKA